MSDTREFRPAGARPHDPAVFEIACQLRDEREAHAATQRKLAATRAKLATEQAARLASQIAGVAFCDLADEFADTIVVEASP